MFCCPGVTVFARYMYIASNSTNQVERVRIVLVVYLKVASADKKKIFDK